MLFSFIQHRFFIYTHPHMYIYIQKHLLHPPTPTPYVQCPDKAPYTDVQPAPGQALGTGHPTPFTGSIDKYPHSAKIVLASVSGPVSSSSVRHLRAGSMRGEGMPALLSA